MHQINSQGTGLGSNHDHKVLPGWKKCQFFFLNNNRGKCFGQQLPTLSNQPRELYSDLIFGIKFTNKGGKCEAQQIVPNFFFFFSSINDRERCFSKGCGQEWRLDAMLHGGAKSSAPCQSVFVFVFLLVFVFIFVFVSLFVCVWFFCMLYFHLYFKIVAILHDRAKSSTLCWQSVFVFAFVFVSLSVFCICTCACFICILDCKYTNTNLLHSLRWISNCILCSAKVLILVSWGQNYQRESYKINPHSLRAGLIG